MKSFLGKHFTTLVILGLFLFLYGKGLFDKAPSPAPTIVVVTDTTDKQHNGTAVTQPVQVQYIPYPVEVVKEVLQDTVATRKIVEDYFSTRIQQDSLHLPDSLGFVAAATHTTRNRVDSISWNYKIKERLVTTTITIKEPYKPRRVLYAGIELTGPVYPIPSIQGAAAGLLYKNRKDVLLGMAAGYNFVYKDFYGNLKYYRPLFR